MITEFPHTHDLGAYLESTMCLEVCSASVLICGFVWCAPPDI